MIPADPYRNLGPATILRADARDLPLADNSVDLIVTSPPYFALRSYQDAGEHYAGQLGSEATPAEFVDALIDCTREMVRVVKPSGSIWVNLGDKYATAGTRQGNGDGLGEYGTARTEQARHYGGRPAGFRDKSLMGIPWRYALRCIDDLGLILRAEVIWGKPNGLPESVTDRVRRSHEQWFHFTLQPRYYSAVDEIREEYGPDTARRYQTGYRFDDARAGAQLSKNTNYRDGDQYDVNPLGKLPGSVWTIGDSGDSVVRSVLRAVSAGALTIDEGERILWAQRETASWPMSTAVAIAGSGSAGRTPEVTARPQTSAGDARTGHTGSPTGSSSDLSPTGSPSTTHAETPPASTPTTSSPSPEPRTSGEPIPSEPTASTGTPSPTPTSTGHEQGSQLRSAAPAPSPESDVGESVWRVPTEPLRVPPELGVDHFAAFPAEFPKRIIRGWSPAGVCTACGEGRRPVVESELEVRASGRTRDKDAGASAEHMHNWRGQKSVMGATVATITAYRCGCDTDWPVTAVQPSTTPALILDPFGGTGTVAMVARALGRHGVHVELSADYNRLAHWRITDLDQLAAVQGHERTKRQPDTDDLLTLLDDGGAA